MQNLKTQLTTDQSAIAKHDRRLALWMFFVASVMLLVIVMLLPSGLAT